LKFKAHGSGRTRKVKDVVRFKFDEIVKCHFSGWIPAFAGMTGSISI
jgi:hypothetical protein